MQQSIHQATNEWVNKQSINSHTTAPPTSQLSNQPLKEGSGPDWVLLCHIWSAKAAIVRSLPEQSELSTSFKALALAGDSTLGHDKTDNRHGNNT